MHGVRQASENTQLQVQNILPLLKFYNIMLQDHFTGNRLNGSCHQQDRQKMG